MDHKFIQRFVHFSKLIQLVVDLNFVFFYFMFFFKYRNQLVPGGSSRVWSLFGFVPFGRPFCSNGTLLPRLRVKFRARQRRFYSNSGNNFNFFLKNVLNNCCINLIISLWQQLYGKSKVDTPQVTFRPPAVGRGSTSTSRPDGGNNELCSPSVKIDTIFTGPDGKAYVFKGNLIMNIFLMSACLITV